MRTYPSRPKLSRPVSVAVDWITITASDEKRRLEILNRFLRLKEALLLMHELPKSWSFRGYSGFSIGSARWGTRDDSDILILSGEDCQAFWRIFAGWATNCSRLDLAVTARTTRCYPRLLDTYISMLREGDSAMLKRTVKVARCDGTGKTLYVNSRNTDQFGRIYDKGAQLGLPLDIHRLWRYEIELKNERAHKTIKQLLSTELEESWPQSICSTVWEWFNQRELPPIFSRQSGLGLDLELHASITSVSQKLNWLTRGVSPTIKTLIDAGYKNEVINALGLDLEPN